MRKGLKALDRILFAIIGCLLAMMVVDVTVQVFFRYVIELPPTWTEELARFIFAWQIFLGAGLAFGRGSHIVVDALVQALPSGGRRLFSIISNAIVFPFLGVLIWQGINMVHMTSDMYSPALGLNMGVVYASLPTGTAIAAVYVLTHLVTAMRGKAIDVSLPPLTAD
jgi:TRAP-type C4-dicarboxylate transport system permease small subunit